MHAAPTQKKGARKRLGNGSLPSLVLPESLIGIQLPIGLARCRSAKFFAPRWTRRSRPCLLASRRRGGALGCAHRSAGKQGPQRCHGQCTHLRHSRAFQHPPWARVVYATLHSHMAGRQRERILAWHIRCAAAHAYCMRRSARLLEREGPTERALHQRAHLHLRGRAARQPQRRRPQACASVW